MWGLWDRVPLWAIIFHFVFCRFRRAPDRSTGPVQMKSSVTSIRSIVTNPQFVHTQYSHPKHSCISRCKPIVYNVTLLCNLLPKSEATLASKDRRQNAVQTGNAITNKDPTLKSTISLSPFWSKCANRKFSPLNTAPVRTARSVHNFGSVSLVRFVNKRPIVKNFVFKVPCHLIRFYVIFTFMWFSESNSFNFLFNKNADVSLQQWHRGVPTWGIKSLLLLPRYSFTPGAPTETVFNIFTACRVILNGKIGNFYSIFTMYYVFF